MAADIFGGGLDRPSTPWASGLEIDGVAQLLSIITVMPRRLGQVGNRRTSWTSKLQEPGGFEEDDLGVRGEQAGCRRRRAARRISTSTP